MWVECRKQIEACRKKRLVAIGVGVAEVYTGMYVICAIYIHMYTQIYVIEYRECAEAYEEKKPGAIGVGVWLRSRLWGGYD